ncbi:MAG TPA: isoprenylcysteine carboxylmethyltransferase family protein [Thermoanaerobaculia bacterium]|jgi:protein-S-isoprenylcysteine O-methyltransferase Ste14
MANGLKSALHNLGVIAVSFAVAGAGVLLDRVIGTRKLRGPVWTVIGVLLLATGFLLRFWATLLFYEQRMRVISLEPQQSLITTGPFRFTRNPLYLGGNCFAFLGAAFVARSPAAVLLTAIGLVPTDFMIRREERQLEAAFGDTWRRYARSVRRWI